MVPSKRLLFLFVVLAPVIVLGAVSPGILEFILLADAVVLSLALADWLLAKRAMVEATRRWPRLLVQDQPDVLSLDLYCDRRTRVAVRETLHPALRNVPFRTEVDLRTLAAQPDVGIRIDIPLHPMRRGEHQSGPLVARVLGPWGLMWHQRALIGSEAIKVYPRVRWGGRVGQLLALARRRELGEVPLRHQGIGGEMYALRRYREGDPRNRIHWRASAKRGELIVREDALERGAPLVLLFDCGRSMTASAGKLGKLDYALAAGLAMLRVASSRGDKIRVAAFSDRIERQIQVRPGEAGIRSAYEQLYDLEATAAEPVYDLVGEWVNARAPGRATVVLFTSVVDLAAAELLRSALNQISRRHRAMLINLEDPVIRSLAEDPPKTAPEVFAKLYSLDILLHNRKLAAQLRRRGILTVSASADRLALASLESYFALLGEGMAA